MQQRSRYALLDLHEEKHITMKERNSLPNVGSVTGSWANTKMTLAKLIVRTLKMDLSLVRAVGIHLLDRNPFLAVNFYIELCTTANNLLTKKKLRYSDHLYSTN